MSATRMSLPLGAVAPDFDLPGVDGRHWNYAQAAGPEGLVLMFICNHCPYVKAVADRIAFEAQALAEIGVGSLAVNSNDAVAYPEDAFERMPAFARHHGFEFPYLYDETQALARACDAQCTPEFFGFDKERVLRYHGRLDASGRHAAGPQVQRELFDAMRQVAEGGHAPAVQHASIGCSIKWKRG
jgi:peroxiredoxin